MPSLTMKQAKLAKLAVLLQYKQGRPGLASCRGLACIMSVVDTQGTLCQLAELLWPLVREPGCSALC